jgi:transposase
MTITHQQVNLLMKNVKKYSLKIAAAKSGMSDKTARKYIKGQVEPVQSRSYRTRKDPFEANWSEVEALLMAAPELQAHTLLAYLIEQNPTVYHAGYLRTLQRRLKHWRAEHGGEKNVIFRQQLMPGQQSQSDWTRMGSLGITLAGKPFEHILYHFMLPYSLWESVMICYSESFDTLTQGYEKAVFALGGVMPEHRTDNLSAATQALGGRRQFTERWETFLSHYGVKPSRNNPGESHENGSVEKSHDTFKNAVRQHLLLRGSHDFVDLSAYEAFLTHIQARRNAARKQRVVEDVAFLRSLPERRWRDPTTLFVRVSPSSTIQVLSCTYSVPSRLISFTLRVDVYPDELELYYGQKRLLTLPRLQKGIAIDYRHILDSLIRKPGAFAQYQYREALFPHPSFRKAFDTLKTAYPSSGHKHYLKVLQLAKLYGEQNVVLGLALCFEGQHMPLPDMLKPLLEAPIPQVTATVIMPTLSDYDSLHAFGGESC